MLLGAVDSGKTTLARYLVEALVKRRIRTAIIDSDIGQSGIGLPGTICMKVFRGKRDLADFVFDRMTFLGFTNPAKVIPRMVAMTVYMIEMGRRHAGITVVDTTGLVSGEPGKALKIAKIRAIRPAHVVAIQRKDELEHILSCIRDVRIFRLKVSPAAKKRSASSRSEYRKKEASGVLRRT
jgi:polynucleotide 5'-kinase involved in rRNA processing